MATALTSSRSKTSNPDVFAIGWKPVCMPVSPLATQITFIRVRTRSSLAKVPSEFATRIRRARVAEADHTWVTADPVERAASSADLEQLDAPLLRDVAGHDARPQVMAREVAERDGVVVRSPDRAIDAAVRAASSSPRSVRSVVWAKPVDSPTTTRMPAPRSWLGPSPRSFAGPSS